MESLNRCTHNPPSQGVGLGQCTLEMGHAGECEWEPCKHAEIWPDGKCLKCGVLVTLFPGKVEGFHKMVKRDNLAEAQQLRGKG